MPTSASCLLAATPLLTGYTRALHAAQLLRLGDARPDGFASLQWRRAAPNERWLRLLVHENGDAHTQLVEFLLLAQRLMAVDAPRCEDLVVRWLSDRVARPSVASRRSKCCMGGCRLAGEDPEPVPLSAAVPCPRHSLTWRRPEAAQPQSPALSEDATVVKKKALREWTLGVVLDFDGEVDGEFLALLHRASADPLAENELSDDFKAEYRRLAQQDTTSAPATSTVRFHVRLSSPKPTTASLRSLATAISQWRIAKRDSFSINGVDIMSTSLNEMLMAALVLPFQHLLVCASSSTTSRMDPLGTPTKSLDDVAIRLILAKSQFQLRELEICNVRLANFDCFVQAFASGKCRLRALRLREFAMGVVSDGGIFTALRDPCHAISRTLEELEIDQALHSAGGLSFWLEREAGAMLLQNDRLVKCAIRQACSIYPSTTHKGFWQTRGREIRIPLPVVSKAAFLSAVPTKLPREVAASVLEFAGTSVARDAQMHYRPIMADQLHHFMRDLDAWKPKRATQFDALPYGSYYC